MRLPASMKARCRIRLRSARDLTRFVIATTLMCVVAALAFDVINQLVFFENWHVAVRSWLITVGVVVIITTPVSRAFGAAHLALYKASQTDPLTGLLNRRALLEATEEGPTVMALIIIDIDRFKQVNDTHGHLAGDEVIRVVAGLMADILGNSGRIGRIGGEEFALIASSDARAMLMERLDAFRQRMALTPVVSGSTAVRVTVSAGLATRQPEQTFEQLYARADHALYVAKAAGRNRIVCAEDLDPSLSRSTKPSIARQASA